MIVLETERLILRRLIAEDIDDLARLYADAETMRFFGGPHGWAAAEEDMRWCQGQYERNVTTGSCGPAFWATILKSEDLKSQERFIGRCALLPQEVHGKSHENLSE